ncbi:MAG: hypothetical protein RL701_5245 [Pseudomonadota bacterium]|jgi:hypothetical protein
MNTAYIRRGALALSCALACALLIPTLGIALQNEAVLTKFHSHTLSAWPKPAEFRAGPVEYFRHARTWLAERVYPIELVTHWQKTFQVAWLNSAPEPRITMGDHGHIFLNGGSNETVNGILDQSCVQAHLPPMAATLQASFDAWAKIARQRSLAIDLVVIPTANSLYADRMPRDMVARYRAACLERTHGRSPLLAVRAPQSGPVTFSYPLREMLAARDDDAFFPRGNWHPTGLSLKVVRDTYLRNIAASTAAVDEVLERGEAPAEILLTYGVRKSEPLYVLRNAHVAVQPARNEQLRGLIAEMFWSKTFVTNVYGNSKPVIDETVLMLSDSYGDLASFAFAGAFRQLLQISMNELYDVRTTSQLIELVQRQQHVHRVIVLAQEGNVPKLGTNWAK